MGGKRREGVGLVVGGLHGMLWGFWGVVVQYVVRWMLHEERQVVGIVGRKMLICVRLIMWEIIRIDVSWSFCCFGMLGGLGYIMLHGEVRDG